MTLAALEFEMPRRVVLLKENTRMPNNTMLGVTGDPNVLDPVRVLDFTTGEFLLQNSPPMTLYLDVVSDTSWRRTTVNTWVKLGSGAMPPPNNLTELTLSSISGDNSFHFEDLSIFTNEKGQAILFESFLEEDENAFALASNNELFLEGRVLLTLKDGSGISMSSGFGYGSRLLDPYFEVLGRQGWQDSLTSQGLPEQGRTTILTAIFDSPRYDALLRESNLQFDVRFRNTFIRLKDGFSKGFTVTNRLVERWGVNGHVTYIIFPNNTLVALASQALSYSFRPPPSSDPHLWVGINSFTGVTFDIRTDT